MSGFVLGFKEDDGDVIDFDNDGEVVLHKWVSRPFLVTNIHLYLSPMSQIRVLKDWVKAWLCTLTELQAFVKAVFHHWADLEPILRQGQGSCEGW